MLLALGLGLAPERGAAASPPGSAAHWTARDVDALCAQSVEVARTARPDALSRLVFAAALHQAAAAGSVHQLLATFDSPSAPLGDQSRWLARRLEPAPPSAADALALMLPADASGLVRAFALLGPFEDTGGGLDRREGPETATHRYRQADYSWGTTHVRYQRALAGATTARGVDLDLYIQPRSEACTYLESAVTLPAASSAAQPLVLQLASAGAFRAAWDGVEIARSDEVHPDAVLDRAAVRLLVGPGAHQLRLKVCTAALADSGRVRARFTDERYQPVAVESSSDIAELERLAERLRSAATGLSADPATAPSKPIRVSTPLEQALAVPPDPSPAPEEALTAALLRTLGGAEDLKSPRAPGLLDRVVANQAVRPDELALAGYLSPSAANRSGWLGQALERARSAGDDATASFAQRALVESRLQAGMVELAYATARAEPLGSYRDAHARLLRAHALAALGGAGLAQSALGELRAIVREQGKRTPLAVWRTIAAWSERGDPQLLLDAMRRLRASDPDLSGARYLHALQPLGAAELERAALDELGRLGSAREVSEVGQLLLDAGRLPAARAAFRLGAALSPNTARAVQGLGQTELALASSPAAAEQGLARLLRVKQLEPGQAQLAAEIAFRQRTGHAPAASGGDADDLRYLVEPAVFLGRARANPAKLGAEFERTLHWRRVVKLHADRRVSQLMHWAREIVIAPRTDDERYEDMPSGAAGSELILARVHRKDGSVEPPEEQETPDGGSPSLRWPELQPGDVVEVAVRTWTAGPVNRRGDLPFFFVDYVGSVDTRPVLYNEVVIDAPIDGPLSFDVIHGRPDHRNEREQDGRRITELVWDHPPVVPDEPLAPPQSELLPVVVGSSYPNWEAFLDWYRGAVEGFVEPDEQIRRLAAELTAPKAGRELTREQKIAALFNFVADDIRYVNFVSGEWWLPNRPQQLLARRQGDCDDKAMLLISLLKAVGIDAVEALVQTRYTSQPSVLESAHVAVPMFDHGITYLLPGPKGEPGRWLDATSPESRLGPLPAMDAGAMVLLVERPKTGSGASAPSKVSPTPAGAAAEHGIDARWTLAIASDGQGDLTAKEHHVGDAALLLRTQLQQADARAQWIEQELLSGWFSALEMSPDVTFRADLPGGAAEVEYRAHSSAMARRDGEDLVVVVAPRMPITAELAPLVDRKLPVLLPPQVAPRHHLLEISVEAPRSHRFAELPPDSVEDGKGFGMAKLSFVRAPGRGPGGGEVVTVRREIAFERTRIEVADYPEWRRWLQRIDRLMQRGVRLRPAPAPAAPHG